MSFLTLAVTLVKISGKGRCMDKVFLLEIGYRDTGSTFAGVFSSHENAKQRVKEMIEGKAKSLRPDFFYISSALVDIGELIAIETISLDENGNIIPRN